MMTTQRLGQRATRIVYFEDLTPYSYGRSTPAENVLNVGWLSLGQPFTTGSTSERFVAELAVLAADPVDITRGIHLCEFCPPPPRTLTPAGLPMIDPIDGTFGNGEIRVTSGEVTYVAPVLILHYVVAHRYLPPTEFVRAVEQRDRWPNKSLEPTRDR